MSLSGVWADVNCTAQYYGESRHYGEQIFCHREQYLQISALSFINIVKLRLQDISPNITELYVKVKVKTYTKWYFLHGFNIFPVNNFVSRFSAQREWEKKADRCFGTFDDDHLTDNYGDDNDSNDENYRGRCFCLPRRCWQCWSWDQKMRCCFVKQKNWSRVVLIHDLLGVGVSSCQPRGGKCCTGQGSAQTACHRTGEKMCSMFEEMLLSALILICFIQSRGCSLFSTSHSEHSVLRLAIVLGRRVLVYR